MKRITRKSHSLIQQSYSDSFPDVESGCGKNFDDESSVNRRSYEDHDGHVDEENDEVQNLFHAQELHFTESSDDDDHQWALRIPGTTGISASSTTSGLPYKEVSVTCVVCLKQYRPKDRVTWSPSKSNTSRCCHAFHQDCIVKWLAKVPDCNCPVCRNPFCHLPQQQSSAKSNSSVTEAAWWR